MDEAIRRRLEKRIYIPLPDRDARNELFGICLKNIEVGPYISPETLSDATEGYSGADIHLVCREAAMMPMRRLLSEFSPQQINEMKLQGSLQIPVVSTRLLLLKGHFLHYSSTSWYRLFQYILNLCPRYLYIVLGITKRFL